MCGPTQSEGNRRYASFSQCGCSSTFVGLTRYLKKFLPHLADMTKPLKDLTQKDTAWMWDNPQQTAFMMLKNTVSSTLIL